MGSVSERGVKLGVVRLRLLAVLILPVLLPFLVAPMGSAASDITQAKTSGALYQILQRYNTGALSGAQAYAQTQGVEVKGNKKLVVVIEGIGDLLPLIRRYDGEVQAKYQALWQVELPLTSIPYIASFHPVHYLRLPLKAGSDGFFQPSSPTDPPITEGLRLIGADKYHERGYKGQGVKIAIIDLGFAGLQESIAAGALPEDVLDRAHDFTQARDVEAGTSHGTAVAEIVHAVAPEAELYLYKVSTEVELGKAVQMAIDNGIQIVNHSVGWFNDGFYQGDGTVARIIKTAWRSGIFWVNAAGNHAQHHYEGEFHDSDGDGYHDEVIKLDLSSLPPLFATVGVYLTWDGWPRSTENFDLVLERDGKQVRVSDNPQTEDDPNEPDEKIMFGVLDLSDQGVYQLRVKWAGEGKAPEGRRLEIFISAPEVVKVTPTVPESSIPVPGNAEWVVSVGAVAAEEWEDGILEDFSSRGPTNDGRYKPDLVAPDRVRCFTYSNQGTTFVGTSAAAPHVAGMAALLLSEKPSLPVRALGGELVSRAWPVRGGTKNQFGAGRAQLTRPKLANLTITSVKTVPSELEPGQELSVQLEIANQGAAAAPGFWVALWKAGETQPGSELDSYRVRSLPPGETRGVTLMWRLPEHEVDSAQVELLVALDPYGDVTETDEGDNERKLAVQVNLPKPTLSLSPAELNFGEVAEGGTAPPVTLQVKNVGAGTLSWEASCDATWIELEPREGELDSGQSQTVTVRLEASDLTLGRHKALVEFTAEDAEGSPQEVSVAVLVYKPPALEVSQASVSFTVMEGGEPPEPQSITITNSGGRTLSWTAETDADWLVLSRSEGELEPGKSDSIELSVRTADLAFGEYQAEVVITAPGAEPGRVEVPVELSFKPTFKVSSVTFPARIPADGTKASGTVEFLGSHHVVRAIFEVVKADSFSGFEFNPYKECSSYTFDPSTGQGSFDFSLYSYVPQRVELKLTLVDEEGNETEPYRITFECVAQGP